MFMTTQEERDFILRRDRESREGAGGIEACVEAVVVAEPTGKVWGFNKEKKGPLDGQPECKYHVRAIYANNTVKYFRSVDYGNFNRAALN